MAHQEVWLVFKIDRNGQVFVLLLLLTSFGLLLFADYLVEKSLREGGILSRACKKAAVSREKQERERERNNNICSFAT